MNVNVDGMHYYDLQRNWTRKIVPHLDNQTLNAILVRDFNNYYLETLSESFRLRYWAYVALEKCEFCEQPKSDHQTNNHQFVRDDGFPSGMDGMHFDVESRRTYISSVWLIRISKQFCGTATSVSR